MFGRSAIWFCFRIARREAVMTERLPEETGTKRKRLPTFLLVAFIYVGNDLRSHTLSRAVPSARRGLTSVFGMGTGGSPAVRSPTNRSSRCFWSVVGQKRG